MIFGCMILNSTLLLLIRSFSAAILMLVKKRYFAAYMAGDMALYLLQKVGRGDFHYSIPIYGAFGLFISLLLRVIVKMITDFTGLIQMRHPGEVGGLYWTTNAFLALLASFVCVWVGNGGAKEWELVGAASGLWILTFAFFLLLMKKEYRRTFFNSATGKEQLMDRFKVDDDAIKASVLKNNKKMWRGIRGEAKTWVLNNWWRWQEEKPKWMTESWLAKLPDDFVPDDEDQAKLEVNRKKGSATKAIDAARITPVNLYATCDPTTSRCSLVAARWQKTCSSSTHQLTDLDKILTAFAAHNPSRESQTCTFFSTIPGSPAAGTFDFVRFARFGVPFLVKVALEMPTLFAKTSLPISAMRSSWPPEQSVLGKFAVALTRKQCACLLAHSFLGSLRRPAAIQPNDFRFTVVDLFMGTAVSPNSATTFLNFFSVRGAPSEGGEAFEQEQVRKNFASIPLCFSVSLSPRILNAPFARPGCLREARV